MFLFRVTRSLSGRLLVKQNGQQSESMDGNSVINRFNKETVGFTIVPLKQVSETEYKEFEPRLKFKPRLKYGWFHLKLYSIFQDFSIETGFWQI